METASCLEVKLCNINLTPTSHFRWVFLLEYKWYSRRSFWHINNVDFSRGSEVARVILPNGTLVFLARGALALDATAFAGTRMRLQRTPLSIICHNKCELKCKYFGCSCAETKTCCVGIRTFSKRANTANNVVQWILYSSKTLALLINS